MASAAVAVTGVLAIASGLVLGQFDYIVPTIQSVIYLSHPSTSSECTTRRTGVGRHSWHISLCHLQLSLWVSSRSGAVSEAFQRRSWSSVSRARAQLLVCVLLQFVGQVQILEVHYFSSMLWAGLSLLLATSLVQLSRPILDRQWSTWALPLLLLLVPLAYELDPHVPPFGWLPFGDMFAVLVIALAVVARRFRNASSRPATRLGMSRLGHADVRVPAGADRLADPRPQDAPRHHHSTRPRPTRPHWVAMTRRASTCTWSPPNCRSSSDRRPIPASSC